MTQSRRLEVPLCLRGRGRPRARRPWRERGTLGAPERAGERDSGGGEGEGPLGYQGGGGALGGGVPERTGERDPGGGGGEGPLGYQ